LIYQPAGALMLNATLARRRRPVEPASLERLREISGATVRPGHGE
jgi:hypothetical protein